MQGRWGEAGCWHALPRQVARQVTGSRACLSLLWCRRAFHRCRHRCDRPYSSIQAVRKRQGRRMPIKLIIDTDPGVGELRDGPGERCRAAGRAAMPPWPASGGVPLLP